MKRKFTYLDILDEAIKIITNDELDVEGYDRWCPWCACAQAKSRLDRKYGTGLTWLDATTNFHKEVPSDYPLIQARWSLGKWNDIDETMLTQSMAIDILEKAKLVGVK